MALTNNKSLILDWWLRGLEILIPEQLKNVFSTQRPRIVFQMRKDQMTVSWPASEEFSASTEEYKLQEERDLQRLLNKFSKFPSQINDHVLSVPAQKGLRKFIKLPLTAESDLDSILQFEVDRQTPFTQDKIYYGYRVSKKDVANNQLNVELNVIPKKIVDTQLRILKKIGITPKFVELYNESGVNGIDLLPHDLSEDRNQGNRTLNTLLLIVAFCLLVLSIIIPFYRVESALEGIDAEIEDAQKDAQEVNELRSKWEAELKKQNFVEEKINSRQSITEILYELTRLLPDNTWLSRIFIKNDTVRLQGESSSATSLISIIEKSDYFKDTRFQSPVTSNVATGKDRFQITSKIVPADQLKKPRPATEQENDERSEDLNDGEEE